MRLLDPASFEPTTHRKRVNSMRSYLVGALLLATTGCQAIKLGEKTLELAGTTPDVLQQQVLDNLAMLAANPVAMPYYLEPGTGTAQIARTVQASYSPGWTFITSGVYVGRYLFDKQGAQ